MTSLVEKFITDNYFLNILFQVAVLGKIDSEWKVWTLDDSGRIEVPLDSEHHESFPIGVCIDISSIPPAEIGMLFLFYVLAEAGDLYKNKMLVQKINIRNHVLKHTLISKKYAVPKTYNRFA